MKRHKFFIVDWKKICDGWFEFLLLLNEIEVEPINWLSTVMWVKETFTENVYVIGPIISWEERSNFSNIFRNV